MLDGTEPRAIPDEVPAVLFFTLGAVEPTHAFLAKRRRKEIAFPLREDGLAA